MKEFVAHLHPLLVHLPIGILLLAAVFAWMGRQKRNGALMLSLPILLRLGAAAAILSCLSGWLLGSNGEYNPETLQWHQWLGISTTALAVWACFDPKRFGLIVLMALLLIATGHFGGTMTHGEGYLMPTFGDGNDVKPRPTDVQEAVVYTDIIAPILKDKCTSCHGGTKQKGGLRLDSPEKIQQGGKDGLVLKTDDPNSGELIRRCLLPLGHEDHMPPKEKPQLSPEELEILRWWLFEGANFQKKAKEFPQTGMIQNALSIWQRGAAEAEPGISYVPIESTSPASPQLLEQLRHTGLLVLPVSRTCHWLSVNFVNLPNPDDSVFVLLEKIAPQVIWVNMQGCWGISELGWRSIGHLSQLTRLSLNQTSVSDSSLTYLTNLQGLQYLNLSQTPVTTHGVGKLAKLKALRHLFLFQTGILPSDLPRLQSLFTTAKLDSGGYVVPFMDSDTVRLKAEKGY